MLTLMAAIAMAALQDPSQAQVPAPLDPAKLIGQMFKRYADAKTVSGKIRMVQAAMSTNEEIDTTVAIERPDLILIEQRKAGDPKPHALLVSDGVRFEYTGAVGNSPPILMAETLHPVPNKQLHIPDMYPCVLGTLEDHSVPLDIAVARTGDLKIFTQHLHSFALKGLTSVLGRNAYDIAGEWQETNHRDQRLPVDLPSGTFELYISPEGDFVRLERRQRFKVSAAWLLKRHMAPTSYPDGIEVVSTWDADLAIDHPVDHRAFVIRSG